jgi:fatty acid CoA ligase FadD9
LKRKNVEKLFAAQLKEKRDKFRLQKLGPAPSLSDGVAVCRDLVMLFEAIFNRTINANTRFSTCGGDSVMAVSVIRQIAERYCDNRVSSALLIQENLNCTELAEFLRGKRTVSVNVVDFRSELNSLVENVIHFRSSSLVSSSSFGTAVLVTGASGFLGKFICESLLRQGRDVFCLVRSESSCPSGCVQIVGDLAIEHFGLSPQTFAELQDKIGRVIHCASNTNSLLTYKQLFDSNVLGTCNVIHFCGLERHLSYVSTLGVVNSPDEDSPVEAYTNEYLNAQNGYVQTKWMAECLVRQTCKEMTIFRPGMIAGSAG